jgi:hypothetical protein
MSTIANLAPWNAPGLETNRLAIDDHPIDYGP